MNILYGTCITGEADGPDTHPQHFCHLCHLVIHKLSHVKETISTEPVPMMSGLDMLRARYQWTSLTLPTFV